MSRAVMQQALEALIEHGDAYHGHMDRYHAAITALRAALAEPDPEPVAWWNGRETAWFEHELMGMKPPIDNPIPLYTAPTPRKPEQDDPSPQFAHRLAIMLECALLDPKGSWDEAHRALDEYRAAVQKWHEAHGEPYVSAFGKD